MPVDDHPVHPHGQRSTYRAGCYNRKEVPLDSGFWVQDGWITTDSGQPYQAKFVWVSFKMSTKCRQINVLPECEGCTAPKDKEYLERMRELK